MMMVLRSTRCVVALLLTLLLDISTSFQSSSLHRQWTANILKTVSHGTRNALTARDAKKSRQLEGFQGHEPSIQKSHFFSQKSLDEAFHDEDPSSLFSSLCEKAGISRPSKIQALAWPVISKGNHAIIADQTGSGKTLSYLIPLLYRLQQIESLPPSTEAAHPRLLILAPTAELADQIHAVCWKLLPNKNACGVLTATGNYQTAIRDQIRYLQSQRRLDVLISTPGRIATILRTRQCASSILNLSHLHAVVWDEVDFLLREKTFGPQLATVGAAAATTAQCVFVTATLPDTVVNDIRTQFPGAALIKGPGLHKVAPSVAEKLVDVSTSDPSQGTAAKCTALVSALRQNRCRRTLIFCNTVPACRAVVNLLERNDRRNAIYHTAAFHSALAPSARNAAMREFRQAPDENLSYVLVCTDRAARGVDFIGAVDHVVIYDFPSDPADYIRRVGRTARAGLGGQCTVLAYGWQLPIARAVMNNQKTREKYRISDANNDDDEEEEGEYWVGKKRFVVEKDKLMGGNIAGGQLWTDKR